MAFVAWLTVFIPFFVFFDVWYFLRGIIVIFSARLKRKMKPLHLLEESFTYGICWTTDLDFMLHMNNARYLRECDFARFKLWLENGVWSAVDKLHGQITLGASTIRYRRSINFLHRYRIRSKILCWDDKAFYVEQRVENISDNFVCAIAIMKQSLIKVTPPQVMTELGLEMSSPEVSPEVQAWIESNQISSEKLKSKSS